MRHLMTAALTGLLVLTALSCGGSDGSKPRDLADAGTADGAYTGDPNCTNPDDLICLYPGKR